MDRLPFFAQVTGRNKRPQRRPFLRRFKSHEDVQSRSPVSWQYILIKTLASVWLFCIYLLCRPIFTFYWSGGRMIDTSRVPIYNHDFDRNYFSVFYGQAECGTSLSDVYDAPKVYNNSADLQHVFCKTRSELLESMSNGGRHGVDAAFSANSCQHRWYSPEEICMILERFENIVFIGDEPHQAVFAGLNVLLRKDLALGALEGWSMTEDEKSKCACDRQFQRADCQSYWVKSAQNLVDGDSKNNSSSPLLCSKSNLHYLSLNSPKLSVPIGQSLRTLIPVNKKAYKPIPIVYSLTYSTIPPLSPRAASTPLLEILNLADSTDRKTPILSLGPTAPSPFDQPSVSLLDHDTTEQTINKPSTPAMSAWDFSLQMRQTCREHDVEFLGMWNLTIQASSLDLGLSVGSGGGGRGGRTSAFNMNVAITQAMMVVNWLARLESS